MKKILVFVDFSEVTGLVVENAKLLAKSFGAELKLVYVVASVPQEVKERVQSVGSVSGLGELSTVFIGPLNYDAIRGELALELKAEHKKMLEIKKALTDEKIKVKACFLEVNVSDVASSQIKEYEPDMIVMGSHGHGYFMKVLLGSVTTFVLKHARCPVVIVPYRKKQQE